MDSLFLHCLRTAYGCAGLAITLAYLPQAVNVWKSRDGARDVSLLTWSAWSVCAAITLLYAGLVTRDLPYTLLSAGNLAGCFTVTAAAWWRRTAGKLVAGS